MDQTLKEKADLCPYICLNIANNSELRPLWALDNRKIELNQIKSAEWTTLIQNRSRQTQPSVF